MLHNIIIVQQKKWLLSAAVMLGSLMMSSAVCAALASVPEDSTRQKPPVHFAPIEDRWRAIKPPLHQYNVEGRLIDPYNQNILKGDYPIIGQKYFMILTATADNFFDAARVPTMTAISTQNAQDFQFFGNGNRAIFRERLSFSFEFYKGNTAFRPRDFSLKINPVFGLNYINARERSNVNIDERLGPNRYDDHLGFQDLSFEKHLFDLNTRYDFLSVKVGIQEFNNDFRGFLFKDSNLGVRFLGSAGENRYQYNLAYFRMIERDTNSGLNTLFENRNQDVILANLYKQDFLTLGYTAQFSFAYNNDKPSIAIDENGIPVRPAIIAASLPHDVKAFYLGWSGDGHFGILNISHAFYQALGRDSFNSLAGRPININAQMAALELSVDRDWIRYRVSGFYASGDSRPADGTGTGFDAIIDEPFFAGGPFSYWNSQQLRVFTVSLSNENSFLPNLRGGKTEGQANFINPGLMLFNLGMDVELTPKARLVLNSNYLGFVSTNSLTAFANQVIRKNIGLDYGLGLVYRPFLNNNAIINFGFTALTPLGGFNDIFDSPGTQFSGVFRLVLTF